MRKAFPISLLAILLVSGFKTTPSVPKPETNKPIKTSIIKPLEATVYAEAEPVTPVVQPTAPKPAPTPTTHEGLMAAAGIAPSDYGYADYIVSHESTWSYTVVNSIGATGLCQSLPGSKMATAGADYLTNPVTQLRWCDGYAKSRYGSWAAAYSYWLKNHLW